MTKNLNKIIVWGIAALTFGLPLFFLPLTTDFYGWNKNFLLILGVLGIWGIWGIWGILRKKTVFIHTPLDLPILVFGLAVLASTLLASPNKVESLLLPGGAGTILGLTLLYFVVTNHSGERSRERGVGRELLQAPSSILPALTASAVVLAVVAICQFLGVGESLGLAPWLAARTWTPAGGLVPLASFLGVVGVVGVMGGNNLTSQEFRRIGGLLRHLRGGQLIRAAAVVVILGGLGVTIYHLTTTNRPLLLPYSTGWVVAMEAFKNNPLWGVGPGQFASAFTRFKPLAFNQTDFWALRFAVSSNWYFQLLTEVGIVGLGAWGWIVYKVVVPFMAPKINKGVINHTTTIPLVVIFLLLALLPANFLLLLVCYLLLAQYALGLAETHRVKISLVALREGLVAVEKTDLEKYYGGEESFARPGLAGQGQALKEAEGLPAGEAGKIEILPWLVFVPTVIIILGSFYFLSRVYAAEMDYKKALDAAVQNKGKETYDLQISAITKNPYFDYYRTSYSQINLALANNLASQPELSDQDRAVITQLVQQAIREGKAAVALNSLKVRNWENLASIYRNLINFAEGADQWVIAASTQAINLDPFNPGLRIDLGGVWYGLKNYDQAQRQFEIAVNLKPDLANAHYNLAAALKEKGELELTQQQLEATLSLLEAGSADYQKVKGEIEAIKEGVKEVKKTEEKLGEISPPKEVPEGIEPPLELGKEAGPEVPEGIEDEAGLEEPEGEVIPTVTPITTP